MSSPHGVPEYQAPTNLFICTLTPYSIIWVQCTNSNQSLSSNHMPAGDRWQILTPNVDPIWAVIGTVKGIIWIIFQLLYSSWECSTSTRQCELTWTYSEPGIFFIPAMSLASMFISIDFENSLVWLWFSNLPNSSQQSTLWTEGDLPNKSNYSNKNLIFLGIGQSTNWITSSDLEEI